MIWAKYRRPLLLLVYVMFFLHTALWHYFGYQNIGHLGFGEFFGTLRSGIVTAGTLFTLVIFFHALFFGGLFCGWLCHWGITQDLAAWIMEKAGIKPKMQHLDSRLIPWIWFLIIIAQVVIYWVFNGLPTSLSFNPAATPVWSGVPRSILLICLTTMVSGFLLIFLFGERAFCRSICTFRLWFSWFERFAPHKVRQIKECSSCARECSAVCPMGLDVAAEIRDLGHVKSTGCVKCAICIGACPNQALQTSFRKNAFHRPGEPARRPTALSGSVSLVQGAMALIVIIMFGFDVGGNISLSLGFLAGFLLIHVWHTRSISLFEVIITALIVVGLYFKHDMNDPVSLGKGLIVLTVFMLTARFAGFTSGLAFINSETPTLKVAKPLAAVIIIIALLLGASETRTSILIHQANAALKNKDNQTYVSIMENCAGAHAYPAGAYFDLARVQLLIDQPEKALESMKKSLELSFSVSAAQNMFEILRLAEKNVQAAALADYLADRHPHITEFRFMQGNLLLEKSDFTGAEAVYTGIINSSPNHHDGYIAMGELRLRQARNADAADFFSRAYSISPASAAFFMADINRLQGNLAAAEKFYAEAVTSNPPNVVYLMDQGTNYAMQDKFNDAIRSWQAALALDNDLEPARENIRQAEAALAAKKALILGNPVTGPGN